MLYEGLRPDRSGRAHMIDMAHLAPRPDFGLAVKVKGGIALAQQNGQAVHVIANQVFHHDISMTPAIAQG